MPAQMHARWLATYKQAGRRMDDKARRLEALKANDLDAYAAMLKEQVRQPRAATHAWGCARTRAELVGPQSSRIYACMHVPSGSVLMKPRPSQSVLALHGSSGLKSSPYNSCLGPL